MRVTVVKGAGSALAGAHCRGCRRVVREGESVLFDTLDNVEWGERHFVLHADCARVLADRAPAAAAVPSDPRAAFFRARAAMRAAGSAFVEVR